MPINKYFYFLVMFLFSMGAFSSSHIVVLNSIPNTFSLEFVSNTNYYVESSFKKYLDNTSYSLEFIHKATLEDYLNVANRDEKPIVFWISHGNSNITTSLGENLILDYENKNVAHVFNQLDFDLPYFSVVACGSREILKDRNDIEAMSGKKTIGSGVKEALKKFHGAYGIERNCKRVRRAGSKIRVQKCFNSEDQDFVRKQIVHQSKKTSDQSKNISMTLFGVNETKFDSIQIFVNDHLIETVLTENESGVLELIIPEYILKTNGEENELFITSGYLYGDRENRDLDSLSAKSDKYKIRQFSLGNIKTINGSLLFYFK